MVDGSRAYNRPIYNDSGYVLLYPNVGDETDLLQGYPPNPYAETVDQQFPLGTRLIRGSEEWLYCLNGAGALATLGTPLQQAKPVHAEQDDDIVTVATTPASAIGDYTVTLTSTANIDTGPLASAGGMKEGFLIVNDAVGQGQLYKIKDNEAFVTTGNAIITLYDPLTIALTAASECGLVQNPCANVIATEAPVSGTFIGVNQIAVTAAYYFWAKHKGPAPAVAQAKVTIGCPVAVGTTAAKFNPATAATTQYVVGFAMTPLVLDTEQFIVDLK